MSHPIYQSSVVSTDGTKVILHFDQPLSTDTASVDDFSLEVDGALATIDAVSVADDHVELTLRTAIQSGQTVSVSYTDPTADDDPFAIQSSSTGDDADSFSNEPVTMTPRTDSPGIPSGEYPISLGGSGVDGVRGVARHSDGSVTITGYFEGSASFGDFTLSSQGNYELFVARINADGSYQWAQSFGGAYNDFGEAVVSTSDGGSIIAGGFNHGNTGSTDNTIDFGGISLSSADKRDIYITKLDKDGQTLWATQASGLSDQNSNAITSLDDGSSIITGYFYDTVNFGDITLTADASGDIFIAKLDANGDFIWATQAAGSGHGYGYAVSGYSDDSLVVTGGFSGSTSFGDITLTSASSGYDVFIAKLNSDGTYDWANGFGGTSHDVGTGVVSLDDGGALVTGYFHNTVTIGDTTLTSAGNQDIYIAKVNSDGTYAWVTQAGSSTHDFSWRIVAAGIQSFLKFTGTATFSSSILPRSTGDIFVAKLAV